MLVSLVLGIGLTRLLAGVSGFIQHPGRQQAYVVQSDYVGFEDYSLSRRRWLFGLLALTLVVDVVDTVIKGADYLAALGIEYAIRLVVMLVACLVAARTDSRRFHLAFATAYLAYTISWVVRVYWVESA